MDLLNLDELTIEEMKQGYAVKDNPLRFECVNCGRVFEAGEIYKFDDRYFEASRAVKVHIEEEHGNYACRLAMRDSKYNTLTDNQKKLVGLFASGLSDKDIAVELGISISTVRHQKFVFREKAKQAKFYLAVYESAFEERAHREDIRSRIVPVHENASSVDMRYVITEEEREHILKTSFESMNPLKLVAFSPKEKKKIVILTRITEEFKTGKRYSEKEVNEILKSIYEDHVTLRRYLIMYGFMKRTEDGKEYWRG